jgi:hypothetical protein
MGGGGGEEKEKRNNERAQLSRDSSTSVSFLFSFDSRHSTLNTPFTLQTCTTCVRVLLPAN